MNLILISDIILLLASLIILILASVMDIKKREVYDFYSYSLFFFAFIIRISIFLITGQTTYFFRPLFISGAIFLITYLLYIFGQWGGGDSKILISLCMAISYLPNIFYDIITNFALNIKINYFLIYFIMIFFVGAIYTLIWMSILFMKNIKTNIYETYNFLKKKLNIIFQTLIIILLVIFKIINSWYFVTFLLILILYYIIIMTKVVEKTSMTMKIKAKDLTEGDWVSHDVVLNNKIIYKPVKSGIELSDINKIIKKDPNLKIKIKVGIPFVPVFLLSLLLLFYLTYFVI